MDTQGTLWSRWRSRLTRRRLLAALGVLALAWLTGRNLHHSMVARNETRAIVALASLRAVQTTARHHRLVDRDGNGVGEYLTLEQLAEQTPPLIGKDLARGTARGYYVQLYVGFPSNDAEKTWHAIAVPRWYALTGRRTFYVDEGFVVRTGDTGGQVPTRAQATQFLPLGL